MTPNNFTWNDLEVDHLKTLLRVSDPLSASEIAAKMNVKFPEHFPKFTRNSIIGKVGRIKEKLRLPSNSHDRPRPRPPKKANAGVNLGVINVGYVPRMSRDGELDFDKVPDRNKAYTIPRKHFLPSTRVHSSEKRYERKGVCTWPLCDKESRGSYCEEHKKLVYQPRGQKS